MPVPRWGAERYEQLLGLPSGQLVAVIETMHRYARGAPPRNWTAARDRTPADDVRIQNLLDRALSEGVMSGPRWDRLTWHLVTDHVLLPSRFWVDLTERLLVEMIISDGVRWHQRYEAFNRLLSHPVGQFAAIAACTSLGSDRSNQVVVETISALDFSSHRDANSAVIRELREPSSDQAQLGALLACFRKLQLRHFAEPERRVLSQVLLELSHDSAGGAAKVTADQLLALSAHVARSAPAAGWQRPVLTGSAVERELVVSRVVSVVNAWVRPEHESFHDAVLPTLVEEMLYAASWDVRLAAASFIAASPYRDGTARALAEEFKSARALLERLDWALSLLSALRLVGRHQERRLLEQVVLYGGASPAVEVSAAYSIGHLAPSADVTALRAAVTKHATQWRTTRSVHSVAVLAGLSYSAGVSGRLDLLQAISRSHDVPRPLVPALTWWLGLPSWVLRSVTA
ncbi:hypothetical protein [Kribbella solani]|uniref:Uncharacterized protein n=1 Tax=Kribbella solani TaxID=236067 RepID=A0A841DJJ0_9ACTN|nr:hypothetical protein [Kribbella solani]MBB5977245.1 hypothetical protein [Kribbella solani]